MTEKKHENLAQALAAAQDELEGAKKNSSNPHFRSKYADLAGVWEAWQEVGPKNGLAVLQLVKDAGDRQGIVLETVLIHESGERISSESFWPAVKNDPQAFGSALTYARRYTLSAIVGVCPVEDDGNKATEAVRNDQAARFEEGLKKVWDDKAKLAIILGEANKAGLTKVAEKAHKRIQELG